MLKDAEKRALLAWYGREEVLLEARKLYDRGDYEELEEYLHQTCLFPLSRHDDLPDFMRDTEGRPLFPTNLDPRRDEGLWQDAIEVAWEVMEAKLGFTHDDVHRAIAEIQQKDWQDFLRRAEERHRRSRGEPGS